MIDLSFFATKIESDLNDEISNAEQQDNALNNDKVKYRFRVMLDGGEFKDFDYLDGNGDVVLEQTNRIVRYINCELDITGSQSDGVQSVEMSINSRMEILVPLINAGKKKARLELINAIRQVIDNAFRLNSSGTIEDDDDNEYQFGILYQLADTGSRDKRLEIGDSMLMSAYLSFFIVQEGVNSADYELYIDNIRVPFTRIGFNRGATNESNVLADSNGVGKNTATSTVFGLNFDMAIRKGDLGDMLSEFLFYANNTAHNVMVVDGATSNAPNHYLMLFNDVSINGEKTKFASVSVTMVEALKEGNTLSTYAKTIWGE